MDVQRLLHAPTFNASNQPSQLVNIKHVNYHNRDKVTEWLRLCKALTTFKKHQAAHRFCGELISTQMKCKWKWRTSLTPLWRLMRTVKISHKLPSTSTFLRKSRRLRTTFWISTATTFTSLIPNFTDRLSATPLMLSPFSIWSCHKSTKSFSCTTSTDKATLLTTMSWDKNQI